jgi:hypothetical protein
LAKILGERGVALAQITSSGCWPILDVDHPTSPYCRSFNDLAVKRIIALHPNKVIIGAVMQNSPDHKAGLERTLDVLTRHGIAVDVIGVGPIFNRPVPIIVAERITKDGSDYSQEVVPDTFTSDRSASEALSHRNMVRYISMVDIVCHQSECRVADRGTPLFFDVVHLNEAGSLYFAEKLADVL